MEIVKVESTESTNSLAATLAATHALPFAVAAHEQTVGRGQRGNSWESEPGQNLTLSIVWKPLHVVASEQFVISQTVAVAIVEMLRHKMPEFSDKIAIKWPNDIYVGNRKICGVLIENSLTGNEINRSIIGIGLNVNQTEFRSDAPNPVSMKQLTGQTYDIDLAVKFLCDNVERFLNALLSPHRRSRLRGRYFSMLWRSTGFWPYRDAQSGECFEARLSNIASTGHITLTDRQGQQRTYAFKEVAAIV